MISNHTPTAAKTTPKCTVLLVPDSAWATLNDTLQVDSESSAIDPLLRQEIKAALAQVKPITGPIISLLDVAEEVPRCAHLLTGAGTAHIIGDERIGKLKLALRYFRSSFEIDGGRRQYRKQLV